jgi:exopolysaccharide biosynthesis polyprenyl glycosylphosphotransferase
MSTAVLPEIKQTQADGPQLQRPLPAESPARRPAERNFGRLVPPVVDFLLICASGALAFGLRFSPPLSDAVRFLERPLERPSNLTSVHISFLLLYVTLLLLSAYWQKLYSPATQRSRGAETDRVLRAVVVATLVLTAFVYLSGTKTVSRLFVALTAVCSTIALVTWRKWRSRFRIKQFEKGNGWQHTLIVGAGKVGQHLATYLEANPIFGSKVMGFLDANHYGDPRVLGKVEDFMRVARREFIDEVIITIPSERELVKKIASEARGLRVRVKVIPELYDGIGWLSPLEYVGDLPVRVLTSEPIPELSFFIKRLTDILVSFLGLALISPLLLLVAVAVKLDSPGPIFYKASRVGRKGRRFTCYKFRTMIPDADQQKKHLAHLNERVGPLFKLTNDPRVTRLGGILRKYSLDELPQLWNVLKGDMSLVGPRPPEVNELDDYNLEHLRRLEVLPGITGLWQVSARHEPSFDAAFRLDSHYIENWSLLLDFWILLRTIPVVLKGLGR